MDVWDIQVGDRLCTIRNNDLECYTVTSKEATFHNIPDHFSYLLKESRGAEVSAYGRGRYYKFRSSFRECPLYIDDKSIQNRLYTTTSNTADEWISLLDSYLVYELGNVLKERYAKENGIYSYFEVVTRNKISVKVPYGSDIYNCAFITPKMYIIGSDSNTFEKEVKGVSYNKDHKGVIIFSDESEVSCKDLYRTVFPSVTDLKIVVSAIERLKSLIGIE